MEEISAPTNQENAKGEEQDKGGEDKKKESLFKDWKRGIKQPRKREGREKGKETKG
jgi:hypothetical protein